MAQEEQNQSGGRITKKLKQKKIPQRGLGVEKLEKIRLEEQRKTGIAARPVVFIPSSASSSSCSSSTLYRTSTSIPVPHLDLFGPPPPLPSTNSNTHYVHSNNEPVFGWWGAMGDGHGCIPSTWNSQELDVEPHRRDTEFTIGMNSQNDLRSNWHFSGTIPRKQQHQQFSSLVNVYSSSSPSSGLNLQIEPPSNQSCYSTCGPPSLPEEEKMVGMKRPWPFFLDNPPGPSGKFHPIIPNFYRPDESSSYGNMNIGTLSLDSRNVGFREAHSSSIAPNAKWSSRCMEENGALDGNSLTLGLSSTTSSSTASKSQQPLAFPHSDYPQFNGLLLPSQGSIEGPSINPGSSVQEQPIYSFFPPKRQQIGQEISNERRGEAEKDVDLTLKL